MANAYEATAGTASLTGAGSTGGGSLTIDNATIGYDVEGMNTVYKDIKANLIDEVIKQLDANVPTLISNVNNYWIGASADAFKTKIENDTAIVKKRLREIEMGLTVELNQMMRNVNNSDATLAEDIKAQTSK